MIRELKEEVERLRKLAQGQALPVDVESLRGEARREAEAEAARKFAEYEEELAESKKLLAELGKSWEERERDAADIEEERKKSMIELGLALSDSDMAQPQLININQDPTRSGAIIYALKPGMTTVGRPDAPQPQNIKLLGLNMSREHCVIRNDAGMVSIASAGGRTWINGELLQDLLAMQVGGGGGAENGGGGGAVVLQHQDRVRFGNNHLFRFYDPARAQPDDAVIDWEYAQLELATAAGGASLVREISEDESKARTHAHTLTRARARGHTHTHTHTHLLTGRRHEGCGRAAAQDGRDGAAAGA
jgi:kinesin family protein 1